MAFKVVALPGDGVGPEVMKQALSCLRVLEENSSFEFDVTEIPCGGQYYLEHGSRDWPEGSEELCDEADIILLGAVGWPDPQASGPVMRSDGHMAGYSAVLGNRQRLNLYANVRPVKLLPGVKHQIHGEFKEVWQAGKVNMVFVRENTEGLYAEQDLSLHQEGVKMVDQRVITKEGSDRVIRYAFELCRQRAVGAPFDGKLRVTCITKENVLAGCRFFKERFLVIGEEFPDIEKETVLVDSFAQAVMIQPEQYDVLVSPNMFGDILTDLAAVLQGGMGMASSANVGDTHAMFEPVHGTAPHIANQDKANPIAMLLALKQGLEWLGITQESVSLGLIKAAKILEASVEAVVKEGRCFTVDLVGEDQGVSCTQVSDAVIGEWASRLQGVELS